MTADETLAARASRAPADTPLDPAAPQAGLARDKLGVVAVAFFVIAAAAPMAALVGAGPVLFSSVGAWTPLVYAATALLIALFAVGYLRMSRYLTNAGGFVAYIAKGLGVRWATGGAGLALLTYLALQIGLWSQFGAFAQLLVADLAGLDIAPAAWVAAVLALVTVLTVRGVDASLKLLGLLIVAEIVVIVVLVVALVAREGLGLLSLGGAPAQDLFGPGLGIALLFAFLCFTSFEATVVFSEEARDPQRTIPRALYVVIVFVGLFYTLATWVIGGAVGVDAIKQTATDDPAGFIFALADTSAGPALSLAMQILVVTSFVALLLGLSNMVARYLFALGRAGVLPKRLSAVSRTGVPAVAALVNSAAIAVPLLVLLLLGADPLTIVFTWFSALGTVAFVAILVLTSVAVVFFFARLGEPSDRWATIVAPGLSVVVFLYVAYLAIDNYSVLSGAADGAAWLLLAVPLFFLVGVLRAVTTPSIDYEADRSRAPSAPAQELPGGR